MIAKITRGTDPGRIGAYLHGPGRAEEHVYAGRLGGAVIAGTVPVLEARTSVEWVAEMRSAITRRPDITSPVWQASLRSAPGDRVMGDAEWADAAQGFATRMGFAEHPWVAVRHGADHVHVVVSRVDHTGAVWHGRFDRRLAQQACARLEVEHRLRVAPRSRAVDVTPGQQQVAGGPADGQLTKGEWRRAVATDSTPTRVVLTERIHTAAQLAAGRGRPAFEAELARVGVAYQANEAPSTGRMNGYRFADPTHRDKAGEPVWFKASQLDKTLSWAALDKRLSDPPLPAGEAPVKRRLQTRTAHDKELAAIREAASADRSSAADRNRDKTHAQLRVDEHRWARVWADRGTATPGKTADTKLRAAGGVTAAVGDTRDPKALAAAVEKARTDRVIALTLSRPRPTAQPPSRGSGPTDGRGYTPPSPSRDPGRGR